MTTAIVDLAFNVIHALRIMPPDYVRSFFGDVDSWSVDTCPPTELRLAEPREWSKGLPTLAHILIPALPWAAPLQLPFSDLLFRPSMVFDYPANGGQNPTPKQKWFFINGICTDRNVVLLNARYLHRLFQRPFTVLHNFTRGVVPDLAACAVGKEWEQITESTAVAFPEIYGALKKRQHERIILVAHSQGTIISAVILELLKGLHPPLHQEWAHGPVVAPEHAVARRLATRWNFEGTMEPAQDQRVPGVLPAIECTRRGLVRLEPVTRRELSKLEMYCFANCATYMMPLEPATGTGRPAPWIESYGNAQDIVARLGVLANASGPGAVHIGGDRYQRKDAWGHLLNAHYLYPVMRALGAGDRLGGLTPLKGNRLAGPRLFEYLDGQSPAPHDRFRTFHGAGR